MDDVFSSRISAVTVVGVALTFWLPYLTSATGTPLVNPFWATIFGIGPAIVSLIGISPVTFLVALAWPLAVTMLVGALLTRAAAMVSRVAHLLIWLSLTAVMPIDFAAGLAVYRTTSVYHFVSM